MKLTQDDLVEVERMILNVLKERNEKLGYEAWVLSSEVELIEGDE